MFEQPDERGEGTPAVDYKDYYYGDYSDVASTPVPERVQEEEEEVTEAPRMTTTTMRTKEAGPGKENAVRIALNLRFIRITNTLSVSMSHLFALNTQSMLYLLNLSPPYRPDQDHLQAEPGPPGERRDLRLLPRLRPHPPLFLPDHLPVLPALRGRGGEGGGGQAGGGGLRQGHH